MVRRRKAEELAISGSEAGDKLAKVRVAPHVGVVLDAFPIVVGATIGEFPDIALPVGAPIVASGVPGVVVEDGYRAARGDHWLSSGRVLVLAVAIGDEESWGLILVDIFEAEPEVELAVATVGFSGRQQRVVAIVDVERPALAARIGDQTQSGSIVYLVGVEPASGERRCPRGRRWRG